MSFVPAAWMNRRARVALEEWNGEHPERVIAWEWVEELILSYRRARECASHAPEEARAAQERYAEFAQKLPASLVTRVFNVPDKQEGEA